VHAVYSVAAIIYSRVELAQDFGTPPLQCSAVSQCLHAVVYLDEVNATLMFAHLWRWVDGSTSG